MYGLKQAPRALYCKVDNYFHMQGFERSLNAHTLYKKLNRDGDILLVCIYVDDIVYMGSYLSLIREFKSDMEKNFEMTNLGMQNYFLSL